MNTDKNYLRQSAFIGGFLVLSRFFRRGRCAVVVQSLPHFLGEPWRPWRLNQNDLPIPLVLVSYAGLPAVAWNLARKSVTLFRRDESDAAIAAGRRRPTRPLAKAGDSDDCRLKRR